MVRATILALSLCLLSWCTVAQGQRLPKSRTNAPLGATNMLPNLVAPTFGGTQFWSDQLVLGNWRIQQNVLTEHCRLLDENNRRHAWGSMDDCLRKLDEVKQAGKVSPITGKVVITLHGLGGWRGMMTSTGKYLTHEGGYTVLNITYASTRRSLDDHAKTLAAIIDQLDGASEINFVCHSLGNLVVRRYLALAAADPAGIDPRFKRMVMLGPPNHGASLARHFRQLQLYGLLLGPSAQVLAADAPDIETQLATPPFEFAIIAGTSGINPLIDNENDLLVTVAETKLPGASDFMEVPRLHAFLMNDTHCQECTLRFLQHGYLVSPEQRQPITAQLQANQRP